MKTAVANPPALEPPKLDARSIEPKLERITIHEWLNRLVTGQALIIVEGHDPRVLRREVEAGYPGEFSWSYLERGPLRWRVVIRKN